jgi:hypothetical protein
MDLFCCQKQPKKGKQTKGGKTVFVILCEKCGRRGEGARAEIAVAAFKAWKPAKASTDKTQPKAPSPGTALVGYPTKPAELPLYIEAHLHEIAMLSAAFIDRPALANMVKRNVRYIVNNKAPAFLKLWESPEGQASIIEQLEEAFSMGATLPEMGSLVPFGTVCEFIPAVECFSFALTQGRKAPFLWINIEPIYKHDIVEVARVNGQFTVTFKTILPARGEIKAVAVYGALNKPGTQQVIGELYAVERLMEKAETHSAGYRSYLRNLNLFEIARTEGRVKTDAEGREYADVQIESKDAGKYAEQNRSNFEAAEKSGKLKKDGKGEYAEVELPKKGGNGATWTKKIYRAEIENPGTETKRICREDIVNPYDGPDKPEMMRKSAGKSFLAPYMKVRNSVAAMDETRRNPGNVEDALDGALSRAFEQFEGAPGAQPDGEIIDADFTEGDPPAQPSTTSNGKPSTETSGQPQPAASTSQARPAGEPTTKKEGEKEDDKTQPLF